MAKTAAERRAEYERTHPMYCEGWDLTEWHRQETMFWRRRNEPLTNKPGRLPSELPRGERDGPIDHERRSIAGSVRDWAEGSRADAAKLLFATIKELELEVTAWRDPWRTPGRPLADPWRTPGRPLVTPIDRPDLRSPIWTGRAA